VALCGQQNAFLSDESNKAKRSLLCGAACPQPSTCERLSVGLSNSRARHVAENKLAIQAACRTAKDKALTWFKVRPTLNTLAHSHLTADCAPLSGVLCLCVCRRLEVAKPSPFSRMKFC
jgi:hypothetical protein